MMIVVTLSGPDGHKCAVNAEKIISVNEICTTFYDGRYARSRIILPEDVYVDILETPEEVANMCNKKQY